LAGKREDLEGGGKSSLSKKKNARWQKGGADEPSIKRGGKITLNILRKGKKKAKKTLGGGASMVGGGGEKIRYPLQKKRNQARRRGEGGAFLPLFVSRGGLPAETLVTGEGKRRKNFASL